MERKKLQKNLKNKGFILPSVLLLITICSWLFSLAIIHYKSEVEVYNSLKNSNNDFWFLENLSTIAEYEVFKADSDVNKNKYKDVMEYFEGKDLVWITGDKKSESGFKRIYVKQNDEEVKGTIKLTPYDKNILKITLSKFLVIDKMNLEMLVKIVYKYPYGERNFLLPSDRYIENIEVRLTK